MKYLLIFIIIIHGFIHLLGVAKAFHLGTISQLTKDIPKLQGILWLITTMAFVAVAMLLILKKDYWWMVALGATVVSQILIITVWQDAKFGTIANAIILIAALLNGGSFLFEGQFKRDVEKHLKFTLIHEDDLLTLDDLDSLPEPIQRYLIYAGVVNKPKVKNMCIAFEGEMREKGKDWFSFTSRQYNFFDQPARLFFMKAKMFGISVPGYHHYAEEKANMKIRPFGIIPVAQHSGPLMNQAETVTFFNDMCMFAPAALIDNRIEWEFIDRHSVSARFTNGNITISATLYFNDIGQLIDFRSDDRIDVIDMKKYTFSTPVKDYQEINGFMLPGYGEAIWLYPQKAFVYGKLWMVEIKYNVGF